MVRNRRGLAPWSLAREAGIESATVDGTIEVPQYVQPVLDTGFVDEKGDWKGIKSSDKDFIAFQTDLQVANGGEFITPNPNSDGTWPLDMTGYTDLVMAVKPTDGGNISIKAIMGPDTLSYANLSPINAAATLRGSPSHESGTYDLYTDASEAMTADVWNIISIQDRMLGQKVLQVKISNQSGDVSNIQFAYLRVV